MKKQIFLLSLIFCGIFSYSQQWTFLGFPDEKINSIAVHPQYPDILFVSGHSLYKSYDAGDNWDTVAFHSFNSITFHPDNPDTMYATFGIGSKCDGIYKSIDGGMNWSILEYLFFSTSLIIPGYPKGTIVAGTKGTGIYESNDYGDTWITKNDNLDNLNVLSLAHINPCDCDSNQVYFAGTEGGIFYYDYDNGGPWYNTNTPTNAQVHALSSDQTCRLWAAIDGYSNSAGMYKSLYGVTWNVSEYWDFITDILINPLNINTVYAADSSYGVKRTINEGISWQTINEGLDDSVVYCLAQSHADTMHLYAGTEHGLYVYYFTVGINKTNPEKDIFITMYPNPANTEITIETTQTAEKTTLAIYNIHGQEIVKQQIINTKQNVDIRSFPAGVYVVKAINENEVSVGKFVKE